MTTSRDDTKSLPTADQVNAELRESEARLTRQVETMQHLHAVSTLVTEAGDIAALHQAIVDAAILIMGSDGASFQIVDEHQDALRLLTFRGFDAAFGTVFALSPAGAGTSCSVARRLGRRVIVPDVERCDFIVGTPGLENHRRMGIRAVQSTPLLSRSGVLLGMLSTHWRTPHTPQESDLRSFDVLARQAADLIERKLAEDALRQSEARLRFMAESMPQKTFTADATGRHDYLSQQWLEFAGISPEDMKDCDWPRLVHAEDVPHTHGTWQRCIETGEAFEVEHRCRRFDGEYRWHLSRARAMRDPHEHVTMWIGSSTDVHDVKEANQRKDEFLAMLAHELRSPLAPVVHSAETLRELDLEAAGAERAVQIITRQTARMTRLIDDLLDVSRITRGRIELRRERIDLRRVVEAAIETHEKQIEQKRQTLQRPALPDPIWLDVDGVRLEQVISNLLSNAFRYTSEGGRIELGVEQEPAWIVVRVRDTGIGIPSNVLPRIFDLFSLERAGGHGGGLGIGLTVVRRLVEFHGGNVTAHSAGPGQGSEFVVRLPCTLRSATGPAVAPHVPLQPLGGGARRRILVVEDSEDTAEALTRLLRVCGHEVSTVSDGHAALAAARTLPPFDVILLDIELPGITGYEVAEALRRLPGVSATRIVALTGYGREADRRRSRDSGFDEHLVKPVSLDRLRELLTRSDP